MKIKYLILVVFLGYSGIYAQTKPAITIPLPEATAEIQVMARVQKDKILLRWGVTTPVAWIKLNKYGYQLVRYTVTRDNVTLTVPEKVILAASIKPEPAENWEQIVDTNDNAAIIAQALYGESFEVKAGTSTFENIINQSEEIEQRFTYGLFTADLDFSIAKKAGLGFEDNTVKKNEMYLYKVISNVPNEELEIKSNGKFTGLKEYQDLPSPIDFTASFGNNSSMLSWNFKILSHAYGSYHIERSLDNKNFERITKKPYTGMNQENENNSRIFYVDSIANNQTYSYRVQGISVFGELGPYSDSKSGKGKAVLKYVPHLTVKDFKDDTTVTFTWEFPEEGNNEITGFELNRSDKEEDKYETVVKNIPSKNRTVTYNKLRPANYFTITAIGKQGSNSTSFAMLVQPVDSIPPVKPIGLKGVIDSLGVVKITWEPNKEKDVLGYRIYRGNNPKEEFSQLTVSPDANTYYQDKVVIKSLNDKVYYKVIAVDQRYNMSEFSEVLIVKKPDVIPPSSPVFSKYDIQDDGVSLEWINSSSNDVAAHLLFRQEVGQKDWQLLEEDKKMATSYKDKTTVEGHAYRYAIFAKDDSGLQSIPSPTLGIKIPIASVPESVKGFYAIPDLKQKTMNLSWNYKLQNVKHFEIYKGNDKEPLQLMQELKPDLRQYTDPSLIINTEYQYGIRAVFTDGRVSKMSLLKVKY